MSTLLNPFLLYIPFSYPLNTSANLLFSDVFRLFKTETLGRNGLSELYFLNFTFSSIIAISFATSEVFWVIEIVQAITRFKLYPQQWVQTDFSHNFLNWFCTPGASDYMLLVPSYSWARQLFISKFDFSNTLIISVAITLPFSCSSTKLQKLLSNVFVFVH